MPVIVPVPVTLRKEAFWVTIDELVRLNVNVSPPARLPVIVQSAGSGVDGLKTHGAEKAGVLVPATKVANEPPTVVT